MNAQKKVPNKSELLDWLNLVLKPSGLCYHKIEQLGTGVGYLNLLSSIHPGTLSGIKYCKKPNNEYEYHMNLRILVTAFSKLGIDKNVDIEKLAKLKMQDNLSMLQWFYTYYHNAKKNDHEQKQKQNPVDKKQAKVEQQVQKKAHKIQIPQKLNLVLPDKSTKMQIESDQQLQLKIIKKSASNKISEIQEIIHSENNNQKKFEKILSILNLKTNATTCLPSTMTPTRRGKPNQTNEDAQQLLYLQQGNNENLLLQNLQISKEKSNHENEKVRKQPVYVKCQKLQDKYQQYLKFSILKKSEQLKPQQKQKRQSVRLNSDNQIFEYSPNSPNLLRDQTDCESEKLYQNLQQRNSGRLTDNSNLLQSDRKSTASETNLLDQ